MARLREIVRYYIDELRGGMSHVVFYKENAQWCGFSINLDNGHIRPCDISVLEFTAENDPDAVIVNKRQINDTGIITLTDCEDFIRASIEHRKNLLSEFICEHKPPVMERPADLPADIPFSSTPADPDDPPDLFVYDGSMTPEDFEAAQQDAEDDGYFDMDEIRKKDTAFFIVALIAVLLLMFFGSIASQCSPVRTSGDEISTQASFTDNRWTGWQRED